MFLTCGYTCIRLKLTGIWKSRKRKWNRNWKWKLGMEIGNGNGNKRHTNHWCYVFFIVWLVITLVILLSNGYMTGFTSHVLCLYSCTVLCDYCFWVVLILQAMLQFSLVHMWEGLGTRPVAIWPSEMIIHLLRFGTRPAFLLFQPRS